MHNTSFHHQPRFTARGRVVTRLSLAALALAMSTDAMAADKVSGKVSFKTHASEIKSAVLVRGPDEMDESRNVLRIYLSSADIADRIKGCKTLACADAVLTTGRWSISGTRVISPMQ